MTGSGIAQRNKPKFTSAYAVSDDIEDPGTLSRLVDKIPKHADSMRHVPPCGCAILQCTETLLTTLRIHDLGQVYVVWQENLGKLGLVGIVVRVLINRSPPSFNCHYV